MADRAKVIYPAKARGALRRLSWPYGICVGKLNAATNVGEHEGEPAVDVAVAGAQ
jgi:hypothetical protein